MAKDKITNEIIYNLDVEFVNKDESKLQRFPHCIKFYKDDNCSAKIVMPNVFFEHTDIDEYVKCLEKELKLYKEAFDLMSIVLCTKSRPDLEERLEKFGLRQEVKNFFLEEAKKEVVDIG